MLDIFCRGKLIYWFTLVLKMFFFLNLSLIQQKMLKCPKSFAFLWAQNFCIEQIKYSKVLNLLGNLWINLRIIHRFIRTTCLLPLLWIKTETHSIENVAQWKCDSRDYIVSEKCCWLVPNTINEYFSYPVTNTLRHCLVYLKNCFPK